MYIVKLFIERILIMNENEKIKNYFKDKVDDFSMNELIDEVIERTKKACNQAVKYKLDLWHGDNFVETILQLINNCEVLEQ